MKKISICLMLLCITLEANAQILWKISGKDLSKPSYILGTHHLAPISIVDSIADFKQTLNDVEQVKFGKLYIGESAGAIIASPDTEYMRSVNFDPIEKAPDLKDCTSLDLVDFYTIPHYGNFPFKKKGEKIVQLYNEKLQLIPIVINKLLLLKIQIFKLKMQNE